MNFRSREETDVCTGAYAVVSRCIVCQLACADKVATFGNVRLVLITRCTGRMVTTIKALLEVLEQQHMAGNSRLVQRYYFVALEERSGGRNL